MLGSMSITLSKFSIFEEQTSDSGRENFRGFQSKTLLYTIFQSMTFKVIQKLFLKMKLVGQGLIIGPTL